MAYEWRMSIWYERGNAIVYFRGVRHFLPGPFPSVMDAMSAGEALCRQLGWRGKASAGAAGSG